jgi:D-sedoheptulose 7-phosphate isomerase
MAGTIHTTARSYLNRMAELLRQVDAEAVEQFAEMLFDAWKDDRQAFYFGNGGSASTASHHVLDIVRTAAVPGQRMLRAFCMNDNIGMVTATANDVDYREAFAMPLAAYSRSGDVAVAISASGNSPNILAACRLAKERGLKIVALTGFSGGKVVGLADLHIHVPSDNYGLVEDLHLSVGHMAAQMLKARVEACVAPVMVQ